MMKGNAEIYPSTDLPSDPPSDKEEVTDSYPYSNSENITAEKSAPTSPEVYEIFSDTPNEVPMEINDEIPATTLEKHDKTNVTSVLMIDQNIYLATMLIMSHTIIPLTSK
nr:BPK_HP1_G0043840.mRNA.1.CDS.1 [Saccharomyces cerevisiae]